MGNIGSSVFSVSKYNFIGYDSAHPSADCSLWLLFSATQSRVLAMETKWPPPPEILAARPFAEVDC